MESCSSSANSLLRQSHISNTPPQRTQEIPNCHWFLPKIMRPIHHSAHTAVWSGQPVAAEHTDVRMPMDSSHKELICACQSGVESLERRDLHVQLRRHRQASPETVLSPPFMALVQWLFAGLLGCPFCCFPVLHNRTINYSEFFFLFTVVFLDLKVCCR